MINIFKKLLPWRKENRDRYDELNRTVTLRLEQIERNEVDQKPPQLCDLDGELDIDPAEEEVKCRNMEAWYRDLCRDLNEEAELIDEHNHEEANKLREKAEWAYRTAEGYRLSAEALLRMVCERDGKPLPESGDQNMEMQIDRMAENRAMNGYD